MTAGIARQNGSMTPALAALWAERGRFLFIWVIPILLGGLVSFLPPILNDGDTFWHIAAGRWMIGHHAVPAGDPFSYTYAGQPWVTHEWLSEVAMAAAWLIAGWSGVMLLTGLAVGALAAVTGAWLLRWLNPWPAGGTLIIGLACLWPSLLARPHLLVLPVAALWTIELLRAREASRAPSLWLVALMIVWANLHSSFIVGLGLSGAFALEAALDLKTWRWRTLIGWAEFVALAVLATLVTPNGLDGLAFPLKVLGMKALPAITEWQSPDFMQLSPLEIALLAGIFAAFWLGARMSAVRAMILLGLVHMSLQHVRQEALLGALAPLILAEPLGRALGRRAGDQPIRWRMPLPQAALGGALIAAVLVGRVALQVQRVDGPTAPITALAHVPPQLRAQPVLNDYDFGGYLIFSGVRPYIDGRADMYGDDFVAADQSLQNGDPATLADTLKRYKIRWAILKPSLPLVAVLEADGWTRTYADKYAVVETAPAAK
jgi:hypothetical protein